jgi:hypothetical protein
MSIFEPKMSHYEACGVCHGAVCVCNPPRIVERCKNCGKPLADAGDAFCPSADDACWKEWVRK